VLHVAVEQCGRLEKLQKFEGNKRSCRESLISRREQRLHHQQSQLPPGQLEHEWSDSEEDISGHLQHDITCHVQLEQQHTVLLGNSSPASKWLPVADGPEGIPGCDDMAELPMDHMQTQQLLDQKPQELLPGLLQQQPQQLDQQLSGLAGAGLLPAASSQQQQQQQHMQEQQQQQQQQQTAADGSSGEHLACSRGGGPSLEGPIHDEHCMHGKPLLLFLECNMYRRLPCHLKWLCTPFWQRLVCKRGT